MSDWSLKEIETKLQQAMKLVEEIGEDYPAVENNIDAAYWHINDALVIVQAAMPSDEVTRA